MGLIALLGAQLLKLFTFETAKYLAIKALLIAVVMGLGPIVIFKGLAMVMKFFMTYGKDILSYLMGEMSLTTPVVGLWGVGAYLGGAMKVGEGISLYISWMILKLVWGMSFSFSGGLIRGYQRF